MTVPPISIPGTTNIVPNPVLATDRLGWEPSGVTTTTRVADTSTPYASYALKVDTDGSSATQGAQIILTGLSGPGRPFAGSYYIWGTGAIQIRMYPYYTDATNEVLLGQIITLSATPQRLGLVINADPAKTMSSVRLFATRNVATVGTFYVTAAQVEEGTAATPFTIGTRPAQSLPGFLDLGSPHIGPLRAGRP